MVYNVFITWEIFVEIWLVACPQIAEINSYSYPL